MSSMVNPGTSECVQSAGNVLICSTVCRRRVFEVTRFAVSVTSFLNSSCPCLEVCESLFTATSRPSGDPILFSSGFARVQA
ncbi:hypothetical protein NMG60_11013129 [Bertholletia excelsa]